MQISIEKHFKIKSYSLQYMISQHVLYNIFHTFCCIVTNSAVCFELYIYLYQDKAVNREDKRSRRYRDRDLAKFESSRRYRQR